jgi:hypothetical protein
LKHRVNPGKLMYKNLIPISNKTQRVSITEIHFLMLFREIITVYSEEHTEQKKLLCGKKCKIIDC